MNKAKSYDLTENEKLTLQEALVQSKLTKPTYIVTGRRWKDFTKLATSGLIHTPTLKHTGVIRLTDKGKEYAESLGPCLLAKGGDVKKLTHEGNEITAEDMEYAEEMLAKLKAGERIQRLITLPSGHRVVEQIQPNKGEDKGTYTRYHMAPNRDKSTAVRQNAYLEDRDIINHYSESVADLRASRKNDNKKEDGGPIADAINLSIDDYENKRAISFTEATRRLSMMTPDEIMNEATHHGYDGEDRDGAEDYLVKIYSAEIFDELNDPIEYFVNKNKLFTIDELANQEFIKHEVPKESEKEIYLEIDGEPTTLSQLIADNSGEDIEPISQEDIDIITGLAIGEEVGMFHAAGTMVKRVAPTSWARTENMAHGGNVTSEGSMSRQLKTLFAAFDYLRFEEHRVLKSNNTVFREDLSDVDAKYFNELETHYKHMRGLLDKLWVILNVSDTYIEKDLKKTLPHYSGERYAEDGIESLVSAASSFPDDKKLQEFIKEAGSILNSANEYISSNSLTDKKSMAKGGSIGDLPRNKPFIVTAPALGDWPERKIMLLYDQKNFNWKLMEPKSKKVLSRTTDREIEDNLRNGLYVMAKGGIPDFDIPEYSEIIKKNEDRKQKYFSSGKAKKDFDKWEAELRACKTPRSLNEKYLEIAENDAHWDLPVNWQNDLADIAEEVEQTLPKWDDKHRSRAKGGLTEDGFPDFTPEKYVTLWSTDRDMKWWIVERSHPLWYIEKRFGKKTEAGEPLNEWKESGDRIYAWFPEGFNPMKDKKAAGGDVATLQDDIIGQGLDVTQKQDLVLARAKGGHAGEPASDHQLKNSAMVSPLPDAYYKKFTLPGNGRREYTIFSILSTSQSRVASRKLFPGMSYEEHVRLAAKFNAEHRELAKQYSDAVDHAFMKKFGRKPHASDYKVSGIYSDEIDESDKNIIRSILYNFNQVKSAYYLHNSMLRKKDQKPIMMAKGGHADDDDYTPRSKVINPVIEKYSGGIKSKQDVIDFLTDIRYKIKLDFYFETPFGEYVDGFGDDLFSIRQAEALDKIMEECWEYCEKHDSSVYLLDKEVRENHKGTITGYSAKPGNKKYKSKLSDLLDKTAGEKLPRNVAWRGY